MRKGSKEQDKVNIVSDTSEPILEEQLQQFSDGTPSSSLNYAQEFSVGQTDSLHGCQIYYNQHGGREKRERNNGMNNFEQFSNAI